MGKSISVAALVLMLGCTFWTGGYAQGKIGHLNSDELIAAMPETDSINKILTDLSDEYKKLGEDHGIPE